MRAFLLMLAGTMVFASTAAAQSGLFARGSYYNDWAAEPGVNELHDDGLDGDAVAGDLIYSVRMASDQVAGTYDFKIAVEDWSISWPNSDVSITTTTDNQEILFTFDMNVYQDGWLPSTNVVWSDALTPAATGWGIVGAPAELGAWDPASGLVAPMSNGIFQAVVSFSKSGTHEFKWTADGVWDVQQFGADGAGSNADNITLDIPPGRGIGWQFRLNPATGRTWNDDQSAIPTEDRSWGAIKALYLRR